MAGQRKSDVNDPKRTFIVLPTTFKTAPHKDELAVDSQGN